MEEPQTLLAPTESGVVRSRVLLCLTFASLVLFLACCSISAQQPSPSSSAQMTGSAQAAPGAGGDLGTQANDPTAALKQLQFLNSYNGSYYGAAGEGNELDIRPVLPEKIHGINTITRPALSLESTPNGRTGLGDTVFLQWQSLKSRLN